jgi:hypothetical protein
MMEINLSKLRIVQRHDPRIVNMTLPSKYPPLYTFIRFWGRLPDYLLDDLMGIFKDRNKNILFDPFGGSGSVIFKGMNTGFSEIVYNDLNPTFAFITNAIFRGLYVPRGTLTEQINELKLQLLSTPFILDLLKVDGNPRFLHKIAYNQSIILKKQKEKVDLGFKTKELNDTAEAIVLTLKHERVMKFASLREKTSRYLKDYSKLEARVLFSVVLNKLVEKGIVRKETKKDFFILSSSMTFPKDVEVLKTDQNIEETFEKKEKKYRYLIDKNVFSYPLQYPDGVPFRKAERAKNIGDLYSTWSKILLSAIWKKIEQFPTQSTDITNVFKLCFLASLYDSSTMQMPHKSGWVIKSFWIPCPCAAKNPLYVFIRKLNQYLAVYSSLQSKLNEETKVLIYNKDIFDFSKRELKDKPDVVITHPPYFSTVQYGELSAIWASWLAYRIPFEKEIVQNHRQGKSKDVYLHLLRKSLEKISSLSRRDADITLIFQSKDQKDWELLDKVLLEVPLELKQIRCYRRSSWWGSKHIFNVGDFDYAFLFRNNG